MQKVTEATILHCTPVECWFGVTQFDINDSDLKVGHPLMSLSIATGGGVGGRAAYICTPNIHGEIYIGYLSQGQCTMQGGLQVVYALMARALVTPALACGYSLFTLRKARSPLILNGEQAFLRVNRLYLPRSRCLSLLAATMASAAATPAAAAAAGSVEEEEESHSHPLITQAAQSNCNDDDNNLMTATTTTSAVATACT